jgi:hypothetical protein
MRMIRQHRISFNSFRRTFEDELYGGGSSLGFAFLSSGF